MPISRITLHYAKNSDQPDAAAKAKISIFVQARYINMAFHNSADSLTPGQQLTLEDQSAKQHAGSPSLNSNEAMLKLDGSITDYVQVCPLMLYHPMTGHCCNWGVLQWQL